MPISQTHICHWTREQADCGGSLRRIRSLNNFNQAAFCFLVLRYRLVTDATHKDLLLGELVLSSNLLVSQSVGEWVMWSLWRVLAVGLIVETIELYLPIYPCLSAGLL